MLAGKPIIATDISSHTQVLDSDCAILVPPDPAAWAQALGVCLLQPENGKRLAENARGRAEQRHTRSAYENTLLSAYSFDMFAPV